MPKKESSHHQQQGGVSLFRSVNYYALSIITHQQRNVSQPVTRFSLATKSSQQIVTNAAQFVQSALTLHVGKVYTSFWRHIAQRDRSTAAVPARSPYDVGYDHALVQLSYASRVPQHVDDEQDTYFQALTYVQSLDYDRGSLHGFTGQPRQPEREVAA